METTYWHKQGSKPLFGELEWNKPERRDQAGRLLIVGGSTHALSAPAKAYEYAKRQGIGTAKIILPDKTKRLIGTTLLDAAFLPSTTSGEFSQDGAEELREYAQWADTVLLAGDIGRNSQTTILLESLLHSYTGEVILTKDVIESLQNHPKLLFQRAKTTLVVSIAQLQRLIKNTTEITPIKFSMSLVHLVDYLHELTEKHPVRIVVLHEQQILCASDGQVSTTKITPALPEPQPWRINYTGLAGCYLTWYPKKPFEALTHSAAILV